MSFVFLLNFFRLSRLFGTKFCEVYEFFRLEVFVSFTCSGDVTVPLMFDFLLSKADAASSRFYSSQIMIESAL